MYLLKYTFVYIIISISIGLKIPKTLHVLCAIHDFPCFEKMLLLLAKTRKYTNPRPAGLWTTDNPWEFLGVFPEKFRGIHENPWSPWLFLVPFRRWDR